MAELARSAGALRRTLAALAGCLVARRAFERLGYARLGDYARERIGVSGRMLQELARVDAALAELPRLDAALISGRLPWSKVRLIARFATAANEARYIAHAAVTSVRVLEREFRAVERGASERTDEEGATLEATQRVVLGAPLKLAFKWKRVCRYAAQVAGETTPPASVLEWVAAEVASTGVLEAEEGDEASSLGSSPWQNMGLETPEQAGAVASVCSAAGSGEGNLPSDGEAYERPAFLCALVAGLADVDAFELDARLRRAIRLEQRLDAETAQLLCAVTSSEHTWRAGYHTRDSYARERLGMSPRKARALLRLERAGDRCSELREAYRDGALSWVQAQSLARLVLGGDAENYDLRVWVVWAQSVTVQKLEETVGQALLMREAAPEDGLEKDPARIATISEEPDGGDLAGESERQMCARPTRPGGDTRISISAPRAVARLFQRTLCSVRLALERETSRLPSEAEGFEAMLDHALRAWAINDRWLRSHSRKKTAIFERDGWRCTVPGCSSRRSLHAHHIVFRSAGGSDAPDNQTTLCAFHHQRGVHAGRIRVSGQAPHALWFELGIREGKAPLVRYRSGDYIA